jgi:hypothetical protein
MRVYDNIMLFCFIYSAFERVKTIAYIVIVAQIESSIFFFLATNKNKQNIIYYYYYLLVFDFYTSFLCLSSQQ